MALCDNTEILTTGDLAMMMDPGFFDDTELWVDIVSSEDFLDMDLVANHTTSNHTRDKAMSDVEDQLLRSMDKIDEGMQHIDIEKYCHYETVTVSSNWATSFDMITEMAEMHFELLKARYEERNIICEMKWRRIQKYEGFLGTPITNYSCSYGVTVRTN